MRFGGEDKFHLSIFPIGRVLRSHMCASSPLLSNCGRLRLPAVRATAGDEMRSVWIATAVVLGISTMAAEAQAGCNARGEFCNYPNWASNAFAGRKRVPESSLPPDEPYRAYRTYRGKRPVHRYRYR